MTEPVLITGMSVLTASGSGVDAFRASLAEGISGIRETTVFDTSRLRTRFAGEVLGEWTTEVETETDQSRLLQFLDTLRNELFADAELGPDDLAALGPRAGLSFATSVGSYDYLGAHVRGTMPNSVARSNLYRLAERCGVHGPVVVNISACSAGSVALATAHAMIESGAADVVVAGGIDPLTAFSSYGFHALGSLSPNPCTPFEKDRQGISIGEGGALLLLESSSHARARDAHVHAHLAGYGLGNDAYHPTSPDPTGDGALRVMRRAMAEGGVEPADIDYVNAHGTGTPLNDTMELAAVEGLGSAPMLASTKSLTGHCLAAAGAIEAVATILAVEHGEAYGTSTLRRPEREPADVELLTTTRNHPLRYALSNSFAFGGHASSLLIGATP